MPGLNQFGPDGDPFAGPSMTQGAALLLPGSDSALVGPVDAGSVSVTVTQGDAALTLTAADGAGSQPNADGTHTDLTATFPLPLPTGFVYGPVALQWACTVGGVSQSLGQALVISAAYTPLLPDESGVYSVTQGDTGPPGDPYTLLFPVPAELAAGLTGATLELSPLISGMPFLPDPAANLDGAELALDTLGLSPPAVRLTFPTGWGPGELGAGLWKASARLSYAGVPSQTIPLYPVVPAGTSPSKADFDAANSGPGVLSVGGLAGTDPSVTLAALTAEVNTLSAEVNTLSAEVATLTLENAALLASGGGQMNTQIFVPGVGNEPGN